MQRRPLIFLAIALVLGVAAVFLVQNYLDRATTRPIAQPTAPQMQIQDVVVAAVPLFFGSKIEPEHVKLVSWPAESVPPGAFTRLDEVVGEEQRVALRAIESNEPILATKVSGKGGRLSLSGLISEEMRAVTIRVNDIVGVGGFVLPGDRVDVMLTRQIGKDKKINDVILQNVRVLGIDQDANEARNQPGVVKSVTMEVTARQAQKLTLAQQVGSLALALRNLKNIDPERSQRITTADLRYGEANSPRTVKKARVRRTGGQPSTARVKVIRSFDSTSYKVHRQAPAVRAAAEAQQFTKESRALPAIPPAARPLPAVPESGDGEPLDLMPRTQIESEKSEQQAKTTL